MRLGEWSELEWQNFFEREQWVFGYGLDYRIMKPFDREMVVGGIRACGSNPASEFERILRIMQEGATLTEDRAGAARLSTPNGRSIDLIVSPRAGH